MPELGRLVVTMTKNKLEGKKGGVTYQTLNKMIYSGGTISLNGDYIGELNSFELTMNNVSPDKFSMTLSKPTRTYDLEFTFRRPNWLYRLWKNLLRKK